MSATVNYRSQHAAVPGIAPGLCYFPALDGLRGLAILMVLAVHLLGDLHLPKSAAVWVRSGWIGVDLFFVLSGFLITRILWEAKGKPAFYSKFYGRRVLRIWPLYFCLLAFTYLICTRISGPLFFNAREFPWYYYAAFVQNLAILPEDWPLSLQVTWSLAIEEQFYLLWPMAVANLSRGRLQQLAVVVMMSQPILRFWLLSQGASPGDVYIASYCRCDGLACGAWIALHFASINSEVGTQALRGWSAKSFANWGLRCSFLVAIAVALFEIGSDGIVRRTPLATASEVVAHSLIFTLLAIGFGIGLTDALRGCAERLLTWSPLRYCGKISFSLYLVHPTVLILLIWLVYPWIDLCIGRGVTSKFFKGVCVVSAVFLVSHLTWRFIETPLLSLKSRLRYERAAETPREANTCPHLTEERQPAFRPHTLVVVPQTDESVAC